MATINGRDYYEHYRRGEHLTTITYWEQEKKPYNVYRFSPLISEILSDARLTPQQTKVLQVLLGTMYEKYIEFLKENGEYIKPRRKKP